MHDFTGADVGLPWAERPETVGVSSAALERLSHFLEHTVDKSIGHSFPMAGALIARRGKVVYYKGKGDARTEEGTPLQSDSIFRIYSMSKPFTSLALLMLLEEGRLTLEQPAHLYLGPRWEKKNLRVLEADAKETVPCTNDITIRDLLTHTAGLSYGFFDKSPPNPVDAYYAKSNAAAAKKNETLAEMVDRFADLPLCHQPGEAWNYSHAVEVQARVVEVISSKTIGEFLRERFFEPLDMRDTAFTLDEEKYRRLVSLHVEKPDTSKKDVTRSHIRQGNHTPSMRLEAAGQGLVSTFRDYARFCQFCMNEGELDGRRLLGRKTFQLAVRNHLPENRDISQLAVPSYAKEYATRGIGFGLGFAVHMDPALSGLQGSAGQYYWAGAASTEFFCDPEEDLFAMFFTQVLNRDEIKMPLRTLFANIVYGTLVDRQSGPRSSL
ncbi:6-aminohexanoate-dimer hydrolase [Hondaea fermentalgiana]|uniref:6-aminohexanoate-dimer hydrolase n=1 Tax=Hondaea fermentalgiana TaxID=2315210 RepID=A0A2R5GGP7_9STRA|nr:6-aminohexanoate-dimer hydrolase [Hondaea fermentalgiana]|eukprot:GBG27833.1 6-aminohexanoate-dimer hydrolase [Hondaea fermentalgiana]